MKLNITKRFQRNILILLFVFSLFFLFFYLLIADNGKPEEIYHRFTQKFTEKNTALAKKMHFFSSVSDPFIIDPEFEKEDYFFYVFKNDSLIYWSENKVPILPHYLDNNFGTPICFIGNGWYRLMELRKESYVVLGLYLIKNDYQYENEYLSNTFSNDFDIPKSVDISFEETPFPIKDEQGAPMFYLNIPEEIPIGTKHLNTLFIFFLAAFTCSILLMLSLYQHLNRIVKNTILTWILIFAAMAAWGVLLIWIQFPILIFKSYLFSPEHFATNMLIPSIGTLVMISLVVFFASIGFFKLRLFEKQVFGNKHMHHIIQVVYTIAFTGFLFYFMRALASSLMIDSIISFELTRITEINFLSLLGFMVFVIVILSFILLTARPLYASFYALKSWKITGIVILINGLTSLFFVSCILASFFVGYLVIVMLVCWLPGKDKKLYSTLSFVLFFALFASYTIFNANAVREKQNRELLALKLVKERDPLLEYLFLNAKEMVIEDQLLKEMLSEYPFSEIEDYDNITQYLVEKFYFDISHSHDIMVTFCDESEVINVQPADYVIGCKTYFDSIIEYQGKYSGDGLFYIDYELDNDSYLGVISNRFGDKEITIYIEMYAKNIPKGLGYPELLKASGNDHLDELMNYSWAKYENKKLVRHFGDFFYSISLQQLVSGDEIEKFFIDSEGYNHLIYPSTDQSVVVISKPLPNILDIATPFSYFMLLFGVIAILFSLFSHGSIRTNLFDPSLKTRIQLSVIIMLTLSLMIVGGSSLVYIDSLNHQKNNDFLDEKAHSVLIELEHKLAIEEQLTPDMQEYLGDLLYKFSLVFFSDINLYDLKGSLFASSRPEIFDKGLIGEKMEQKAFYFMQTKQRSLYLHKEKIGDYQYLSVYIPFRNVENKTIAYLNLPYFAKQDEITNEISAFIATIINIDIILIAIAIIVALIISNYITRPVQTLKEKIGKIRLGKKNEKIEWKKRDEIGALVIEYNRMLEELEKSADLLARSERESAWRDVARQVAHEIKNPLTPMKLSVQYLQRSWNEKASDWDLKLKKFTETITEQIDTLAKIASDFSDFAKMPKTVKSDVNLIEIISNTIHLFKASKDIRFELNFNNENDYTLKADKEQVLRVFNNLIKNSVQAIPENSRGLIQVNLEGSDHWFSISIVDNGKGIPDNEKDQIFSPNFTTKSSGMGIGLTMVKNIISAMGGTISFESQLGKGTTFIIQIPRN